MNHDPFSQFIEALLQEQGVTQLPPAVAQEMRTEVTERLQEFVTAKLVERLSVEQRNQLQQQVQLGARNEEIATFFQKALGTAYAETVTGILASFRALYVA